MLQQMVIVLGFVFVSMAGIFLALCSNKACIQIIIAIITAIVLIGGPVRCNAMSFQRAKVLLSHLQNVSGYHVQLVLDPDTYVNAQVSNPYTITITQGLLDFCNDAQIVVVMGHELGHIDRQDYRRSKSSFFQEMNADVTGMLYCQKLGYSIKQCSSFMYKARKTFGESSGDGEHPGWTQRIYNIHRHVK